MNLVSAQGLSKSYAGRSIFSGIDIVVNEGEKVGLIGPNGAGKSSLLKILAGFDSADAGTVAQRKGLRMAFLEQTPKLPQGVTVEKYLHDCSEDEASRAEELISKFDLTRFREVQVELLSGGSAKRVALAREVLKEPELFFLDEPTNHLDVESILWLEDFLRRARFAFVVITHDRLFLDRVTNRILELDRRNPSGLLSVNGSYSDYLQRKDELMAWQEKTEEVLKNKLRREMEWLRRGAKARTTKQEARIQATHRLMEEVTEVSSRNVQQTASIEFKSSSKKPKRLIEAKGISKSYGEQILFRDLNLFLGPKDRIGLLGPNGCGKSSLIRILCQQEEPDQGLVLRAEQLKVAYFEQNRNLLDLEQTLRKSLCPDGDHVIFQGRMIHIQGYLDRFLFRKEQAELPLKRLSGGEQARVLIAKLMLKECNVLVLDEPTNDLDIETLDVLRDCLLDFEGGILLVTHDRMFLEQVSTEMIAFPTQLSQKGKLQRFASLEQWERWHEEQKREEKKSEKVVVAVPKVRKRKLSFNEQHELKNMERNIETAEAELKALEIESQDPSTVSDARKMSQVFQKMADLQSQIEKLYSRWSELESVEKAD